MLRSCYRSRWALHQDPTILSPGRYYFADDDTPFAPFPTLLGSRNWQKDAYPAASVRIWGEWDGKQIWDAGAKPDQEPAPRRIGSLDCLSNGAAGGDVAPGNPLTGPFRTVCIGGIVYTFPGNISVCFNVAYQNRDFTYYDDVPLTMVEAECEARWEGPSGIPNTTAIIRVTAGPGGALETNFYLCDTGEPPPEPIVTLCCDDPVPAVLMQTYRLYGSFPAGPFNPTWSVLMEDLVMTYFENCPVFTVVGDQAAWYAFLDEDGVQTTPELCTHIARKWCHRPLSDTWFNEIFKLDGTEALQFENILADFNCATGRAVLTLAEMGGSYGSGAIFGHTYSATFGDFLWREMV